MDTEKLEAATMQFIELSNDLRINMLLGILEKDSGKISEIAKAHSVPAQEVVRNFKRMTESGLVRKSSKGEYMLTRAGEIACYNIPSFVFVSNHQQYFKFHNFQDIPTKFIQRMGSFADTEIVNGIPMVLDRWKSIYNNASSEINVISSELFNAEFVGTVIQKVRDERVKASYIMSRDTIMPIQRKEDMEKKETRSLISEKKIERKMMKKIRTVVVSNRNEAMVMFPSMDGKADMRKAFYGTDPNFIEWCNDYFEYCWKKSESFTEEQIQYFEKEYVPST